MLSSTIFVFDRAGTFLSAAKNLGPSAVTIPLPVNSFRRHFDVRDAYALPPLLSHGGSARPLGKTGSSRPETQQSRNILVCIVGFQC